MAGKPLLVKAYIWLTTHLHMLASMKRPRGLLNTQKILKLCANMARYNRYVD